MARHPLNIREWSWPMRGGGRTPKVSVVLVAAGVLGMLAWASIPPIMDSSVSWASWRRSLWGQSHWTETYHWIALLGLAVGGAALIEAGRRIWRTTRQAIYARAYQEAIRQARYTVIHEVQMLEHAHLKHAVTEAQRLAARVRAASDDRQRAILLNELDHSLKRLRRLVVELHSHAISTDREDTLTPLPLDLERTLVEVTRNFRDLIPYTRIERIGLPRSLIPPRICSALELTLYNALMNAATHGKAPAAWVRVEYGLSTITLTVEDNGAGFDAATCLARGTGRGLRDMHMLARAHGGTLHIESQPGQGTTIQMTLPVPRPSLGWAASINDTRAKEDEHEDHSASPMENARRNEPAPKAAHSCD